MTEKRDVPFFCDPWDKHVIAFFC